MTRERKDAWSLTNTEGNWPKALVAYEKAVGMMRDLDPQDGSPEDRRAWSFQAAIHGRALNGEPDMSNPLWNNCQHGSWFFLPWHRMYLLAFEEIVQGLLGDPEWSLPYWYAVNPDDADTSVLPPAFREERDDNNLYTDQRSQVATRGRTLPNLGPDLVAALDENAFSTGDGRASFGSGERTRPAFEGREQGRLEGPPHGSVHVYVGSDFNAAGVEEKRGWMSSPYTAAADPIFWLHHANIDRLWQVWLELDPARVMPEDDDAWFETRFDFGKVNGQPRSWRVRDVLDLEALGYKYESTQAPSGVTRPLAPAGGGPDIGLMEVDVPKPPPPQVLGSTQGVDIAATDPVRVELSDPVDLGLAADVGDDAGGGRVYLRIEGMTSEAPAGAYEVYLNVPSGETPVDHPELRAGAVSTFGVVEASRSDALHDGTGITAVLDVTRVRDELAGQGRWDASALDVTFRPLVPDMPVEELAELGLAVDAEPAPVTAAQIVVITG